MKTISANDAKLTKTMRDQLFSKLDFEINGFEDRTDLNVYIFDLKQSDLVDFDTDLRAILQDLLAQGFQMIKFD